MKNMSPLFKMEEELSSFCLSDEEYLVSRAKSALKGNRNEAKAWMLTAQTLFPHNFGIQFEAYNIEKSARNVKEAAKCFAALFSTFPEEKELWNEIHMMTKVLRNYEERENEIGSREEITESELLKQIFSHVATPVQHALLLNCAERTHDSMEHCKLMLLLFHKFPATIAKHGIRLLETLVTAEKHTPAHQTPVNPYRKLLVCDLLPLLGASKLELQPKNLFRLLHKATEFYLSYLFDPCYRTMNDEPDSINIEEPWTKLWEVMLNIGTKLGWDLSVTFASYWNRDNYWMNVLNYFQSRSHIDEISARQIVYCCTLIWLRCAHEYISFVDPVSDAGYLLVEGFTSPVNPNEPSPKRTKLEEDPSVPVVTPGLNMPPSVVHSFIVGVRCWDLIHLNEVLDKEFSRLSLYLRLEIWLKNFLMDVTLYKARYDKNIMLMKKISNESTTRNIIVSNLHLATCYFFSQKYNLMMEPISAIATILPSLPGSVGSLKNQLTVATRQTRHLHYLPLHRLNILQYCVKLLLATFKFQQRKTDITLGHMLVLMQLDWPAEEELLTEITNTIRMRGGFSYSIFTHYIINVDILEQFSFLASDQEDKIPLDILPPNQIQGPRRISTRGVDKGAKEDFRMAIRRQVARSNEPIDILIMKFITSEDMFSSCF